ARLGYDADCNLLDAVPKVDGFFSLMPRECDAFQTLIYGRISADFPRLEDFMGVSQITATNDIYRWQSRSNFLPLITAGQKPIFLDDPNILHALTQNDFNAGKIVLLPAEMKSFVTVSNQTSAKILNSKFENQTVDAQIEADAPAIVVISQTYYHDWRAYVDGQPATLLRANYAFQAVQVSAGRHHIKLIYQDRAFEIGAVISLATLLISGIFFITSSRQKKLRC
ncbi:MAG TPA: YfhO family protein, partial [Verrucomicrobiae bacterium]|nr:YfhO family protein [Verrucomicrobiae bacterium]